MKTFNSTCMSVVALCMKQQRNLSRCNGHGPVHVYDRMNISQSPYRAYGITAVPIMPNAFLAYLVYIFTLMWTDAGQTAYQSGRLAQLARHYLCTTFIGRIYVSITHCLHTGLLHAVSFDFFLSKVVAPKHNQLKGGQGQVGIIDG